MAGESVIDDDQHFGSKARGVCLSDHGWTVDKSMGGLLFIEAPATHIFVPVSPMALLSILKQ